MSLDIDLTSSNSSSYDECPICLEDLDKNIAITNCGHQFHFECLSNWIYSQKKIIFTCPSCNQNPCEIINIYSKKKSSSKLNGADRVDSSGVSEINNLESADLESNNRENNRENNRNRSLVNNRNSSLVNNRNNSILNNVNYNVTNNKRSDINNNSVKVCSLCNIL